MTTHISLRDLLDMARMARVVAPGTPHHITQRGNRRMQTFFGDEDYAAYKALVAEHCKLAEVDVWGWCLMPNHVHLILVPSNEDGLRAALGEAHRRYTRRINMREGWRGHLWQERFASFPMDEPHLLSALRYVELNPIRAKLVRKPHRWRWSSARAHLEGRDDGLTTMAPTLDRVRDWQAFLSEGIDEEELDRIRMHSQTGRPLGSDDFIEKLEADLDRSLKPRPPGRPRKNAVEQKK